MHRTLQNKLSDRKNTKKELAKVPSAILISELVLLSKSSAAKTLKVGKIAVEQLIESGKLGYILTESGSIRIPLFELKKYLERNMVYNHPIPKIERVGNSFLKPPVNAKDIMNKIKSGVTR